MENHFARRTCSHCGGQYDPVEGKCPRCGEVTETEAFARGYLHQVHAEPWRQIVLFLIGILGLQIASLIVSVFAGAIVGMANPGASPDQLNEISSSAGVSLAINGIAYLVVAIALFFVARPLLKQIGRSFKGWLPYVAAIVAVAFIIGMDMFYNNLIANPLMRLAGIIPSANGNQSRINTMIASYPVVSVFLFGILGPLVEEIAYRVGLFGFLGRINKVAAYILGMLVFGLIHFDWGAFGDGQRLIIELINLPPYVGAGALLCFVYDRFGFGASFLAHAINNIIGIVMALIP